MSHALRIIVIVIGVVFTLQGFGWLLAPARAAAALGMTLLEGLGRSTQIGDFAAFFFVLGVSVLSGAAPGNARRLYFPAALLASAAAGRTWAWAFHGAAFATTFVIVEVVASVLLLVAAWRARDLD